MRYRVAGVADVRAMEACRARDDVVGPADPRMGRYLERKHHPQQALPARVVFVATDDERVIGYAGGHLTRRFECDGEVQYFYVAPEHRRRGVASALLRHLARWFDGQDARRVCVNVDDSSPGARPFYARHGADDLQPHWMFWRDMRAMVTHPDEAIRASLKSQYHAGLAMLHEAIERCPDDVWTSEEHKNAFWQVAYHTLFFVHLYLQPGAAAFRPWAGHQGDVQHEDGIAGRADPTSPLPLIPRPYTKAEVRAYWQIVDDMVEGAVDALDLHNPESGFHWYPIPKLEHQLVNLRHLQHHTAQLADRLRASSDIGVRWVGSRRPG